MPDKIANQLFNLIVDNRNSLEIPTSYSDSEYFPEFVSKKLNAYYDFLKYNGVGKLIDLIPWSETPKIYFLTRLRFFKEAIIESIDLYYEGKVGKAHSKFEKSLNNIVEFKLNTVLTKLEPNTKFYRIRIESEVEVKKRRENFHIQFDLRHISKTQRYSVPGIPSLYLGDSVFISYQEVGVNNHHESFVSKFVSQDFLKVIEIQTIDDFISQFNDEPQVEYKLTHVLRFLLLYPLYVACTIKVLNTDGVFKPEYIVPQLVMQYVSDNVKVNGIKFPSTKIDINNKYKDQFSNNYVFPVQSSKKNGFCDFLSSKFQLTEPKTLEEILNGKTFSSSLDDYSKSAYSYVEQELEKEKLDHVLN